MISSFLSNEIILIKNKNDPKLILVNQNNKKGVNHERLETSFR